MKYIKEDKSIELRCKTTYPNCIDRKIVKTKSRQPYSRTKLKTSGPDDAGEAMDLFKKLGEE